jgi:hypothetical protein
VVHIDHHISSRSHLIADFQNDCSGFYSNIERSLDNKESGQMPSIIEAIQLSVIEGNSTSVERSVHQALEECISAEQILEKMD